jgi:hypothetical protein
MSSQAQIDANRRNSQKSTGPTSPEGKAASSLNALKSGIHASSHIISGEDPAELEALTAAFLRHHRPAGPNQLALVDTLIAAEWTQRRLRRIEAELWAYQIGSLDKNLTRDEFVDASFQHNSPLGHAYQDALEAFTRLQRRIESTSRMYLRTLKTLQDLQAEAPAPVSEPPSPMPTQPLAPQIGFVSQTAPESEPPIRTRSPNATVCAPTRADSTRLAQALDSGLHPRRPLRVAIRSRDRYPALAGLQAGVKCQIEPQLIQVESQAAILIAHINVDRVNPEIGITPVRTVEWRSAAHRRDYKSEVTGLGSHALDNR